MQKAPSPGPMARDTPRFGPGLYARTAANSQLAKFRKLLYWQLEFGEQKAEAESRDLLQKRPSVLKTSFVPFSEPC